MIKLSLTGRELAEMYALNAMGVPSSRQNEGLDDSLSQDQMNYLIDTDQGRKKLLEYAEDLAGNIESANDERLYNYVQDYIENQEFSIDTFPKPSEGELSSFLTDFIQDKAHESGFYEFEINPNHKEPEPEPERPLGWADPQTKFNFGTANRGMSRWSQTEVSWDDLEDMYERMDKAVEEFSYHFGNEILNGDWNYVINDQWEALRDKYPHNPNLAWTEFMWFVKSLETNTELMNDFWPSYFEQHEDEYQQEFNNDLYDNQDRILDELYDPDDEHFMIKDAVDGLMRQVYEARGRGGKREDYLSVLEGIDNLSSMSHHGGPAFEYGDTTDGWGRPNDEPDLIEIMNRKFGDRFIPWLLATGNFPEEHLDDLQEWYDEMLEKEGGAAYLKDLYGNLQGQESTGNQVNKAVSSDSYYQHPYYSQRDQWLAQNSPTFRGWTPFDAEAEDRANIQSVAKSAYNRDDDDSPRQEVMMNFLNQRGGEDLLNQPNVVDPYARRRPLDVTADIIVEMVRCASNMDTSGAYDLADRMDRVVAEFGYQIQE